MSSPFHSLRKNKVPLFPGHMCGNCPIPFRHPDLSEDESKLLEEITSGMVHERRKQEQLLPLPLNLTSHSSNGSSNQQNLNIAASNGAASPHQNVPSMLRRFGPQGGVGTGAVTPTQGCGDEGSGGPSPPPSDKELMRLMMNRVAVLEQQNQTQAEELKLKDRKIKILEDRLRIAEKARQDAGGGKAFQELETHCLLLQQQVHEMETFLAEYGMVWVGDSGTDGSDFYIDDKLYDDPDDKDDDNSCPSLGNGMSDLSGTSTSDSLTIKSNPYAMWRQDTSIGESDNTVTAPRLNIDFDVLLENIRDLNVLAGAGEAQIKKTSDGARFEVPEPVQLTFYANGLLMFDGPFRLYTEPTTRQCMQDFLDGYFPSELQRRYPDGVPFVVTDLRHTHFQPKHNPLAFAGEGQTLGGDCGPSRLIPTRVVDHTKKIPLPSIGGVAAQTETPQELLATAPSHLRKPLTQAQFLNKLPRSIIKDGKVIDVRDSIGKSLAGSSTQNPSDVTVVNTSVTKEMADTFTAADTTNTSSRQGTERPKSYKGHGDVTTLRVVSDQGAHTYIVKMKFSETVGDLRTYLDRQRRPTAPYDIVSTFPHKVHTNNKMTLEASGLTPNAVLHLKPHKP